MDIYTIGHSTRTIEEFIFIMHKYEIDVLVDVRSYPGSNYVPQFNKEIMQKWLVDSGVEYIHLSELGGRRKSNPNIDEALVSGWEKTAFRNYAEYSLSEAYKKGIDKLVALSKHQTICIMCAEIVPWRCHRLIISNSLVFKGEKVFHIIGESKLVEHKLGMYGAKAVIDNDKIIYPKVE